MRMQDMPLYTDKMFLDAPSGEYVAECQEIPGLSGVGETEEEALAEVKEAVAGWLEVLQEQGQSIPLPESCPAQEAPADLQKTA